MHLEDLIGIHKLSGVDMITTSIERFGSKQDAQGIRFILDGKIYEAIEDPDDGYRSCLAELIENPEGEVTNKFPEVTVLGKMKDKHNDGYTDEIIQFIDTITTKVVLEIGTEHVDDYYPNCVLYYSPENLCHNIDK